MPEVAPIEVSYLYSGVCCVGRTSKNSVEALRATGLSDTQTQCLSGYFFDGMKQSEIAQVLNMTQPAVAQHIKAGCEKLQGAGFPTPKLRKRPRPRLVNMNGQDMDRLGPDDMKAIF